MAEELPFGGMLASRYRFVKRLGQGGMGEVYEAVQVNLNRRVAIKVLRGKHFHDEESRKRFVTEGRILGRISHRNIVKLYDADLEGSHPYLVMEFVRGTSLRAHMASRTKLSLPEALDIASGVLTGLGHLHSENVLHRDLKPENILLLEGSWPKIVDFGLARLAGDTRLTAEGFMVGTPVYMSPEQLLGREGNATSDLYAFGMLLFHMLTGIYPVPLGDPRTIVATKMKLNAEALRAPLAGQPPEVLETIARCLSPDPAERPESAEEVISALGIQPSAREPVAGTIPIAALGSAGHDATTKRMRWMFPVSLAAAAALGLAIAAAVLLRPGPMSEREDYRPLELAVQGLEGACRVTWRSRASYPSRLVSAGELLAEAPAATQHELEVRPVRWRDPPAAQIELPDGTHAATLQLEARPVPIPVRARRLGPVVTVAAHLPETSPLTLELRHASPSGKASVPDGTGTGSVVERRDLAPGREHSTRLGLPELRRSYSLVVRSPGTGVLAHESQPILLPDPIEALSALAEIADSEATSEAVASLIRNRPAPPAEALVQEVRAALSRQSWSARVDAAADAVAWALGEENPDLRLRASVIANLAPMGRIDQVARITGVKLDSGMAKLLGPGWRGISGEPEGARLLAELPVEPEQRVTGSFSSQFRTFILGDDESNLHLDFDLTVQEPPSAGTVWLTIHFRHAVPAAYLKATLNPESSRALELHLHYGEENDPTKVVALSHAFDAVYLRKGENRVQVRVSSLPGEVTTGIYVKRLALWAGGG